MPNVGLHRKAEARTQLINQAYQTLSDPAARARYDAGRQHSHSPTPPPRRAPKGGPKAAVAPAGEATPTVRLLPGLILVALLMAALGLALVLLIARLTG